MLQNIHTPQDLRGLNLQQLKELAKELREFIQRETQTKEGHIKSSLGVVELSIALHKVFQTPDDILIWDVGHQAYAHKILTGRKERFKTNRQKKGISGFTNRLESPYDAFGAGHSSTSISAAVGFAQSFVLQKTPHKVVAVLGDGAFTGGMCFEALNYLGEQKLDVLVVLNDNQSSIDANVGALAKSNSYQAFCESLGIEFLGKCNGHDLEALLPALKEAAGRTGPRLLQVSTRKGEGWKKELTAVSVSSGKLSFQEAFANTLAALMAENEKIVAITPAMLSGSKLDQVKEKFPHRVFDVGIAEQHAVTMAAGMAASGMIPVVHLYSTFSQRAYDQIIHDVALQQLPVVFCIDRAGLVGEDGATHHGSFDTGFFNTVPNLRLSAPIDAGSLQALLREAVNQNQASIIRYPKATPEREFHSAVSPLRCLKEGNEKCVISYGMIGQEAAKAVIETGFSHYDLLYLKPLPEEELLNIFTRYQKIVCVEENSAAGGVGETLLRLAAKHALKVNFKLLALPDKFIEQGKRTELLDEAGLNEASIREALLAP